MIQKIEKKNLLVFGYGLAVILTFLGWRVWAKHGSVVVPACLGTAAVLFVLATAICWESLIPVYKKWMIGAHFIGRIITNILLTVIFYGVFGVAGLILRILRKDLLDRRLEPDAVSYWNKCPPKAFDKKRYIQQF